MKYCSKCGAPMEDEMLFCQKCGTRAANPSTANTTDNEPKNAQSNKRDVLQGQPGKPRKGMKILAIVCGVFAIIYALMSIIAGPFMLSMTLFFGVMVLMFFALSKSPKGTPYLFGKQRGLKKSVFIIICVVLAFVLFGIFASQTEMSGRSNNPAGSTSDNTSKPENSDPQHGGNNSDDTANVLCDVKQFGNITGKELIALLGNPDSVDESTCNGAFEIPCVYYEYNNAEGLGEVSFVLVNNSVVRFTSYNEYPYTDGKEILGKFGITEGENCTKAADTNNALRYRCPSDGIDDFRAELIEGDTFGFLQVTYDMALYEEWYLPMSISERSDYQYQTEETVKQLLKSPKSADFPSITDGWNFGCNQYYVAVQSYVDAQNSFGAELRSEFTFIYFAGTSTIAYAVFDGEVIADNNYVKTADLINELFDTEKHNEALAGVSAG